MAYAVLIDLDTDSLLEYEKLNNVNQQDKGSNITHSYEKGISSKSFVRLKINYTGQNSK